MVPPDEVHQSGVQQFVAKLPTNSSLHSPQSTRSPWKTYCPPWGCRSPFAKKMVMRLCNCPCRSPTTTSVW